MSLWSSHAKILRSQIKHFLWILVLICADMDTFCSKKFHSIQHLIDSGWEARAALIDNGWAEVDCEVDLAAATEFWRAG